MLPRLSLVHVRSNDDDGCESLYFFIEIGRDIRYAVVQRCDQLWWPGFVEPYIPEPKGV